MLPVVAATVVFVVVLVAVGSCAWAHLFISEVFNLTDSGDITF